MADRGDLLLTEAAARLTAVAFFPIGSAVEVLRQEGEEEAPQEGVEGQDKEEDRQAADHRKEDHPVGEEEVGHLEVEGRRVGASSRTCSAVVVATEAVLRAVEAVLRAVAVAVTLGCIRYKKT